MHVKSCPQLLDIVDTSRIRLFSLFMMMYIYEFSLSGILFLKNIW
ncbi:hypothetical protein JMA_00010 [Jeotgalibacillus malaysiensis]|uniref:Uncharacterized protein n=1 Tax=Jeotgalibacillus malaysiensis TaxID=1508404 RepID=A0A0B5ALE4_9BACL|nr:hypothetical protein JMA_00010 [Jeotgalibacillus malaysiensis]